MKLYISHEIFLWFGLLLFGIAGFFLTVLFPQPAGFYAFVAVAALGGFGVSVYVWYTKSRGKQLICPSGGDCNAVVQSKYSKFFSIKLEYLGMLYFAAVFLSYSIILLTPQFFAETFRVAVMLLTATASLFSIYLLSVQAFLLKKWCIWCVLASMFSLTIFFIALISAEGAAAFLGRMENMLEMLKFAGFALGMGGATSAMFLFMRFLRDSDIDEKELETIKDVSELIFVGLALTVMSQFALYVANPAEFMESSLFLVEMLALFLAAFAAAVFMIIYAPFLVFVPFEKIPKEDRRAGFVALRRPSFVLGALALSSWYFAFATNFIPEYGLLALLFAYGAVLALSVAASFLWESQYRGEPAAK
ncbi:MAG: DSBA oxidoreductase [Parcubacteria group bacterium GW2011_GWA2_50_10]|nr:MAG: DSBA oxidoreductase [Parcubacteria group bacterium GW2011_GWA2_50_10]